MIAAGVVTYEPEIERLSQNLEAVSSQVEAVWIIDNGSSNADEIARLVDGRDSITLVRFHTNRGIAAALNVACEAARFEGYQWLLTMDQDSVAPDGMVAELFDVATSSGAALTAPFIVDRNKITPDQYRALELPRTEPFTQAARRGAITSGALNDLTILREVGDFDDRYFIDYVDYDLNQRLLLGGHSIVRANRTHLLHEVGRAEATWLRVPRKGMDGKWRIERFHSFGHSAERCFYKARNRILFTRKYRHLIGVSHEGVWQIPQQIALTILFESGKKQKLASFLRGVLAGIRMPLEDHDRT